VRFRSGYSFRSAFGHLEDVFEAVLRWELGFAPLTDRASTFGFNRWRKLCEEKGVKPIYGVEIAVSKEPQAKKPIVDHWTFIAKDDLHVINNLVSLSTSDGQFRYEPILKYEQAINADCFKIVGHRADLEMITEIGIPDDLYVGLSPSVSPGYFRKVVKAGIPLIACPDNRYPYPEDRGVYEILCGRGAQMQSYRQDIMRGWGEWSVSLNRAVAESDKAAAWANMLEMGKRCSDGVLRPGTLLSPKHEKTLHEMCVEGANDLGVDLNDPVYRDRMNRELDLIHEKKFEDYFYIIADMVQWARGRMVVGPARGSSCGSLVCYLLGITTIDPIPYGLIFERFIDINRPDLPDIDIDFEDESRSLVFDYMNHTYGADRVARLGTVAMYQARSALNEAGAALSAPKHLTSNVSGLLDHGESFLAVLEHTDEGQKLVKKSPKIEIVRRMIDHPRHHSQHAAGIVLTEKPVSEYVAIDSRTGSTNCDKRDAEDLNLLKIDALGLIQLSAFRDALDLAGLPHDHLEKVSLDDQATFDVLNDRRYSGIFQFNGAALQGLSKQIRFESLDDIIAITALGRPGPLDSGGAQQWVDRKNGATVEYAHPLLEPYLKETLGVLTYQEQVMWIAREVADMSWEEVSALRKAISKSMGREALRRFEEGFVNGCIAKGMPEETANQIWSSIVTHGAYSFNKSHSVAYGVISYWCCWLKAHYKMEFAAATLNHQKDTDRQIIMLREMEREGIGYIPVDTEVSTNKWQITTRDGNKVLVGPVSNVKGIGPKLVNQIISARQYNKPLPKRAYNLLENPKTPIDTIWPIRDRVAEVMPDPKERNIHTEPTDIFDIPENPEEDMNVLVICTAPVVTVRDINEEHYVERRGSRIDTGPQTQLTMKLTDDTGEIWAKIDRWKFEEMSPAVLERGRFGDSIFAVKGRIQKGLRFMFIDRVRYLGDLDSEFKNEEGEGNDV